MAPSSATGDSTGSSMLLKALQGTGGGVQARAEARSQTSKKGMWAAIADQEQ